MILRFDGANSRIDCGSDTSLDNIAYKTVCGWVYLIGWGESTAGFFVIKGDTATTSEGWYFYPDGASSTNRIRYNHGWSGSTSARASWYTANGTMSTGAWRHIAVTYDRTSTANDPVFYVDGVLLATTELTAPVGTVVDENTRLLRLGGESTGTRNFDGYMEDVRVFNRILTAQQIAILAGGYDGPMGGEVAWYAPRRAPVVKYERLNKFLDFEEGTTADFDSTSGTVTAGAYQLNGSYGVRSQVTGANYGVISTGSLPNLRGIELVLNMKVTSDFTGDAGAENFPVILVSSAGAGLQFGRLRVVNKDSTTFYLQASWIADSEGVNLTGAATLNKNQWYNIKYVGMRATAAGANNGIGEWFIDGVKPNTTFSSMDNDTKDIDSIRIGSSAALTGGAGYYYFDDISYTAFYTNDEVKLYSLNTLIDHQSSRTNTGTLAGTAGAIQQYASRNTKMRAANFIA